MGVVLRDPGAVRVRDPEVALRLGVPLVGGAPAPPLSQDTYWCHAVSFGPSLRSARTVLENAIFTAV